MVRSEKMFLRAEEVAELMEISVPYAYKLIRQMNRELEKKDCIVINGRIDSKFFFDHFYGTREGNRKQKCQRGFATKREAQDYEAQFVLKKKADINMTLESFCALYESDIRPRIKETTWITKENIIRTKILPYLGKRRLCDITAKDVVDWQNAIIDLKSANGKPISKTFQKTIHAQLSAIFNHAMKYYELPINPAQCAGGIGAEESREMEFWTKEEYLKFAEVMMDRTIFYYAFEVLYWSGIREGELLALTPSDFDFEKQTLRIDKNYQRIGTRDIIQTPKTSYSTRTVKIPKFLCDEMQDCLKQFYHIGPNDRIFPLTKHRLYTAMKSGREQAGVKKIRVHDLRHSHVSLLINSGFSAFEIGKRVGHSAEKITLRYAHLFPGKQDDMAKFLDQERKDTVEKEEN